MVDVVPSLTSALLTDGLSADIERPAYDRAAVRAGIVHIGVGNFHRVHQAVYVDRALHLPDHQHWGIHGVGLVESASSAVKAQDARQQDFLHSVTEYTSTGEVSVRVIGAMVGYSYVPDDGAGALAVLADPAIRIVTLTIGEGGYLVADATRRFDIEHPDVTFDLTHPQQPPRTVFRLLVDALVRRRMAGVPPFTVVSCDNLRSNGDTTRDAVSGYATAVDPALGAWVRAEVSFPNSMVDRIAPRVDAGRRAELQAVSGFSDALATLTEDHLQWVIQDDFPTGRPAWEECGVTFSTEVERYEAIKGRMLNASHVLMSYPSVLLGHEYVHDAMADPRIERLLRRFLDDDAIPLVTGPTGVDVQDYRDSVLRRFANPAVRDQLLRIASDGASKIPVFHTATMQAQLEHQLDPSRSALLLVCFQQYLSGRDGDGREFEVLEPHVSEADLQACRSGDRHAVLGLPQFRDLGLAQDATFVARFDALYGALQQHGIAAAIDLALS